LKKNAQQSTETARVQSVIKQALFCRKSYVL